MLWPSEKFQAKQDARFLQIRQSGVEPPMCADGSQDLQFMEESDFAFLHLKLIEKRRLSQRVALLKVALVSPGMFAGSAVYACRCCTRQAQQTLPPGGCPAGVQEFAPQVKPAGCTPAL
jgi:hypothetical protein